VHTLGCASGQNSTFITTVVLTRSGDKGAMTKEQWLGMGPECTKVSEDIHPADRIKDEEDQG
jgi:hypothetical protein